MPSRDDFLREYFLQTRREIDAEKSSRDQILNFVIISLGAIGFAIFQSSNILSNPHSIAVESSLLVFITSLFWLRRKKLQQISDRWIVLEGLLHTRIRFLPIENSLETIVLQGLKSFKYSIKDFILCICVSCPIYAVIVFSLTTWISLPTNILITVGIILFHASILWYILIYRLSYKRIYNKSN